MNRKRFLYDNISLLEDVDECVEEEKQVTSSVLLKILSSESVACPSSLVLPRCSFRPAIQTMVLLLAERKKKPS